MNVIVEHINSAGHIFVEFALPMLIQSGVLIAILLLVDLLLRKKVKAVFRYWIWMLVLVKLVLPTSLSSPLSLGYLFGDKLTYQDLAQSSATLEPTVPAPADISPSIDPLFIQPNPYIPPPEPVISVFEPAIAGPVSPPEVPVTPLSWQGVVFLVWLAVVIAMGLLLLQRAFFVRGLVAQAKKASRLMKDELAYCCASMGIKCKVGLKISVNATTPSVCGLIRPVILVPWNLTSTLGASRMRTILMHELAHIRRGDLWVNLAQTALQIIYFYNPLLWLANCVIRRVREQAVDEAVLVAMGEKAQRYPQTLVDVAKMAFKRPALSLRLIGVVESKSALAGRIKHILGRPIPKSAKLGLISILAIIIAGAILLPMAAGKDDEGAAEDIAKASEFMATLPNGVTVELVGLTRHYVQSERPAKQTWWGPSGEILEKMPYAKLGLSATTDYRNSNYEFAIRLDGREENTYAAETSLSRSRRFPNIPKTKNDESLPNIRAFIGEFRKEDKEGNIRFGVAAGPWQEVEVWRDGWTGGEAYNVSTHSKSSVVYEWPRQDGNKVVIEVTHTLTNEDRRLLIVDKDGKIHIGDGRKFIGEGAGIVRDIHYFHNLNRKDMEVLKFEKRPYEWVEFKNVSLKPGFETDVQVAYSTTVTKRIRQAGKPDSGRDETYEFLTEPNRKTRLLTPKEWVEIDNWVSIVASVVKDNGRYLLPEDEALTLSELIRADGYDPQRVPVSFLEIMRPVKLGQVRAYSIFSRNLETLFSKKESDPVLKRHDNIVGGYGNPAPNREEFLAPYSFGDVVELIINDDNSENNMFVDLDAGKLVTPDEDLDKKDLEKVLKWMSANGIDAVCNTSPEVGGLIGFGMVALSVDNYFWDADIPDFWDRLIMRIDSPVLISATHVLPATYLIKTSEYKMGILQILGFTDKPEGVRIRYKLVDKGEAERPAVQVKVEGVEPVFVDEVEAARAGISLPVRKVFSNTSGRGGAFEWETSIDPRVRFRHGWYSVEEGVVREHVGAGASRNPEEGRINLKLDVEVKDNMLNIKVQRVHDLDDSSRTAAVATKTTVPDGAYLKHDSSIDTAVLTNKHLTLWQGDFIRDGKVVKSVIYAAYLTTPDDQETGFKPPVLQKKEFVTAKVSPAVPVWVKETTISPTKLVMLLILVNSCAPETELNIESISITARNIKIAGDTSGRTNTQKFLGAIKKNGLEILRLSLDAKGNRDKFSVIVEPKKNWRQWLQRNKTDVQLLRVEENISPKLVMLLQAMADCAAETELNIESISITAGKIDMKGDISSRKNTQKFLNAVKKNQLEILRLNLIAGDNRNKFSMVAEPKENWRQWWQRHKADIEAEVLTEEDAVSNPPQPELLSATPPIFAYDVKLNFADPTVRDGTFHSEQSVAFAMAFHNIEIPQADKILMDHLLIGQTTWPVHLKDNGITVHEGVTGQKIRSLTWPAGESEFEKVIKIPVKYGQKEYSCPVHVELDRRDKESPIGSYWFCAYLSGRLPWGAGGRGFEIVNLDQQMEFRLTGDGTDPRDAVLGIDIDGDGKIDPAKTGGEQFDLYEPFQIGPKTYRLTEVDPYLPRVVFRELALAESLLPSVRTDVKVEVGETVAVSSEGEVKPATTETRSGSELEFRIAPEHVLSSRAPSPLTIEEIDRYKRDLDENGPLASRARGGEFAWFEIKSGANVSSLLVTGEYQGGKYLLLHNREPFVMLPRQGWRLVKAAPIKDPAGRAGIQFELDQKGAELLYALSNANVGRALAIVIDGAVVAVPAILAAIRNKGIIKGNFTEREVEKMAVALRKGMPPVKTDVQVEVKQSSRTSKSRGDNIVVISTGKSTMYSSIQEAIDAAPTGSVIRVGSGFYAERPELEVEQRSEASEATSATLTMPEAVKTRGGISGVVVSSVTGEPIVGAYVGVGDFGDSGGSNYSRHREQGFHDKTKTDEQGRFELGGLVFTDKHRDLEYHPLVVTHPDFVRHDEKIEMLSSGPEPDVKVTLRPAAKINVMVVDAKGNPLQGQWLLRLEALDGRHFIPPGSDPHLSSFASSIWAHMPDLRNKMGVSNGFTFTELDTGEYSIEAIRFHLVDKPTPQNVWKPTITYHGSIPSLKIEAGRTKEVRIKPADYQTSVSINIPEDPIKKPQIPPFVIISRNTGLLLWNDGKAHGPEDHRLGRLQKNALYYNLVVEADVFTIENLPPGSYSVFAGPIYFMSATRMEVSHGREVVVDMPPIQITEHAKVGLWTFDRKVKLQARDYSVSELCGILTDITKSNPRIIADPSIENEKLKFSEGQMPVWDVLEKLYLDKGWKVDEGADKTLIIKPAEQTNVPVEGEREKDTSAGKRIEFFGLDLTDAPRTTKSADLPDLFEARPPGSKSYHIRNDVTFVYSGFDGTVYYIPEKEIFYIRHDKLGSSTRTYYGPFNGDPHQVLGMEKDVPVEGKGTEAVSGESEVKPAASEDGPRITFESLVCDLGQVPPRTKHVCEFKFTNTGSDVLKITKVRSTCGCITSKLKKKEYAPGESETLEATFQSSASTERVKKYVFVYSNDKVNPRVILTVKAEIVIKVAHEPKRFNLVLDKGNAGCPAITLTSLDNQPFSITGFKSTGDHITADFDSSVKETSFVLKPKVDMEKLGKGLNGRIEISLNHPECKTLMIVYKTLPEFEFDPRVVYVREAEPLKSVTKKVWIRSNYKEDVEIKSTSTKKGTVKVLTQEKVRNGYQFELQITPPATFDTKRRVFTDVFSVKLKGGQQLQITCYGIYSKKPVKTIDESVPETDVPIEGEREKDTSAWKRIKFFGLDLTDAPRTTKSADLPDLFEARPPGSKSYHRREDVDVVYTGLYGTVYYIPEKEIFYIQHDKMGASTLHYYGPFDGDPHQVLDMEKGVPIEGGWGIIRLFTALQNDKYVGIRDEITRFIREKEDKELVSFLGEQLKSENRRRRCHAALCLELLGDRRGVPAIIKELNDTSYRPTTRIRSDGREDQEGQLRQDHYYAALLLGLLGDKRAVSALIEATADETIDYQAAMSLGQIGDKRAVPALRAMLDKNLKPFQRLFAGYGLAMLNEEEGLKVVIDTLDNHQLQWTVRRHAIEALGKLGDKEAIPYLITALKDDHPNIRVSAARALGAIGDTSALPALEEALKDNTETKVNAPTTVSKAAAEAIAQIKAGDGRKTNVQVGD